MTHTLLTLSNCFWCYDFLFEQWKVLLFLPLKHHKVLIFNAWFYFVFVEYNIFIKKLGVTFLFLTSICLIVLAPDFMTKICKKKHFYCAESKVFTIEKSLALWSGNIKKTKQNKDLKSYGSAANIQPYPCI